MSTGNGAMAIGAFSTIAGFGFKSLAGLNLQGSESHSSGNLIVQTCKSLVQTQKTFFDENGLHSLEKSDNPQSKLAEHRNSMSVGRRK
jgi:hypothetical protein